jgi:mono/diheme cytochrome c family protein
MMGQGRTWLGAALVLAALSAAACGDPNLSERRGYSRGPLDRPGLFPRAEQPGELARFGGPRRLHVEALELPEQPAAAPAAVASATPLPAVELPEGVTPDMVAQGQQVYAGPGNCFACHGPDGGGTPLAPSVNEAQWLHIDGSFEALVQIIDAGVTTPIQFAAAMPPRGGGPLTDEQVRQVAAYVYSISR